MEAPRHRPAFEITVPDELYWETVKACGGEFADSYLHGAVLRNGWLMPRTVTAWMRLRDNQRFQTIIKVQDVKLRKPPPYDGPPAVEAFDHSEPKRRRAA